MSEKTNKVDINKPFRVFFITSNLSEQNQYIKYAIDGKGIGNFKNIYTKKMIDQKNEFTVSVYSFDIINPEKIKKEANSKFLKSIINLIHKEMKGETKFDGIILFKGDKNSFIYDFKFQDYSSFYHLYHPPTYINFTKMEQLKTFREALVKLKIKQGEPLTRSLIDDSKMLLKGKDAKYEFDFFLELLKVCYASIEVKLILMMFKLERVILPKKLNIKEYSSVLNMILKKPSIIISKCSDKDSPEKYLKSFYTSLLYYKLNYEKDTIPDYLNKKDLWKYFIDIFPDNFIYLYKYSFSLPHELICEILGKNPLIYNKMKGILYYLHSIEENLFFVNKYVDSVFNCCKNDNKILRMNEFVCPNQKDDFLKILNEINNLVNYEIQNKCQFILFDDELWRNYINFNFKKNLNNLLLIKKCILICKKIDNNLDPDYNGPIHETALELIAQEKLKNTELLEFILNDDIFFKETGKNYKSYYYRPLSVLNGFDLDLVDEKFFEVWDKVNIFNLYSFSNYIAQKMIIDKVNHMKDFGKLLRLFNFKNGNLVDWNIASFISQKFKNLIKTYTAETCPNIFQEVSLLIYVLDKKNMAKNFMQNTIQKDIKSNELIKNIYTHLSSNYNDLTKETVDYITNYFIHNQKILKGEDIASLLKSLNSLNFIESIFNKIDKLVIKKEEIFSEENDIDSFKLLDGIQKEDLLKKYDKLSSTKYLMFTLKLQDEIINSFKKGEIKYNEIDPWIMKPNKKEILRERLNILSFHNKADVDNCFESIKTYYIEIKKLSKKIKELLSVLKEFFESTHQNDIEFLENFEIEIKGGMLKDIENQNIKNSKKKMELILKDLGDFNKYTILKKSTFFVSFFKEKKLNNPLKNEMDNFKDTDKDYKKLKLLYEKDWITLIDEEIIKNIYNIIKTIQENEIINELKYIKEYNNLGNINEEELVISRIKDELVILSKKEEIFQITNSCIFFISEIGAKETNFSKELKQLSKELSENISSDKIKKYGEKLKNYGINVLNPEKEDRDYLDILTALYNKKNSLKFILKLTATDCRHLEELVSEFENTFLTGAEIQDMSKCSHFLNKVIGDKNKEISDENLIKSFIEEVRKTKNISIYFITYTNNSGQIQELYLQKLDKSQATLKKINNILNESNFTLSIKNSEEPYFKFEGSFNFINEEEHEKKKQIITFDQLIELRGRAMLTKKLGEDKSKEEKEIFKLNRNFAERVNEIEKINGLLKKIAEKGYSENIEIEVIIEKSNPIFASSNKKFVDYEDCSKYLNKILTEVTETQIKYYKNNETQLMRYIYGRQFNLLLNLMRNDEIRATLIQNKSSSNNSLASFLKYLTNDIIEANIDLDNIKYKYNTNLGNGDNLICSFENINNFLNEFLQKNNINLESILRQNFIKDEYQDQFIGLYTYLLEDDKIGEIQKGIEEHILNWYHFLTGNFPMAQTLLLCNEETTSEEIIAFMYRAFLCQYHVVFMVGKIELLNSDQRLVLTRIINTLFTGHEKEMKSCLVFAYSDKTSTIVQYLERIKGHEQLEHKDKNKEPKKLYEQKVEIISSDKSGVGKSTYIKNQVKKSKKKYIHFPFGGEFNRKEVISRLKEINIKNEDASKTVIHLDLYDTKQTDLMKDFLYSFLITKLYGQNETLFYLSKEVEIKIEIPNGFIDFFLKFPILDMFKNKYKMTIDKLPPLQVDSKLDSNIQIVCNYLKLLKEGKLDDHDLYIKNVSINVDEMIEKQYMEKSTLINGKSLSQKECEELIKSNIGIKNPNYYQINSFINALSGQLKQFSLNFLLSAGNLIQTSKALRKQNLNKIRTMMVKSFIGNTLHFTQGAFDKLLNSQLDMYKIGTKQGNYDEKKQEELAIKALSDATEIISFDKIKPSLVFFHEDGQTFSIISTCNPNEDEYKNLLEIRNIPIMMNNYEGKELYKELNNYSKFEHRMFLKEIKEILNIHNPIDKSEKEQIDKLNKNKNKNSKTDLKTIEEIVGEYVFTSDNFIKMILILLRIRENIPIIMMGETGCGKTSLIRKLSELINNGESKMKILNIHAGITDQEIIDFLNKKQKNENSIIEDAEELQKKEEARKKQFEKEGQIYFENKIWVFLDEINTCNSMGLICEMMTKHSCQGNPLPKNITFIAACNPYRMVVKDEEPNGLKIEGTNERKLVYTVNPLPHSLLNFVFNFGNLTKKDEESYIKNIIVNPIESFYWKEINNKELNIINDEGENDQENNIIEERKEKDKKDEKNLKNYLKPEVFEQYVKLKEIASYSIIKAQEYVRKKNDISSVSLREIRRFSIFYNFFVEYLRNKKKLSKSMKQEEYFNKIDLFNQNLDDFEIYKYSINLSIYLCYYLRLTQKIFRKEFSDIMEKIFGFDFTKIPQKEQKFILDNIDLEKGIAKNRALLENIFTLFVCVNAKIPLFIVGKPGCSKSLSVQLLFNSMKGEISDNYLFKSMPKLISSPYQGSLGSTSKGVLNIFKKARQFLEKETEENSKIISMIYFDEMGLAEHSPNNPLKVIHSELEYDLNEGKKKIAFVGISNWRLDASKMNRGLYLSIPQPDLEDLKQTAQTIAESYNIQLAQKHKDLFENLAITYHDYKQKLSQYNKKEDFHGSRDFYHLIKNAMRSLLNKAMNEKKMEIDEHIKETIGIDSLERNFGGLELEDGKTSLEIIKSIFKNKYENCPISKKYDVLKRIKENINDNQSRYLLLISKSSVSNYLLNSILNDKSVKKDSSFYIGSRFIKDQSSEEYTLKILNKVQLQMEQNKALLLTDLEPVYPALYDLFNQNFINVSKKNYARIAIGSSSNTLSLVDDNFKCIVLVDQNTIEKEEPPFLNRFEKHIISFEYLLPAAESKAVEEIYKMIQDLVKIDLPEEDKFEISYDIKKLLVNCDKEEIQGIVYSKYQEYQNSGKKLNIQDIQDFVLEKIALTLPQDIILLMKYSGFEQKYNNISEKIIDFYQKGEHNNLYKFISTMKKKKNVVYTFTSIDEPLLSITKNFHTEMFGDINKDNISDILISSLRCENDLETELERFYLEPNKKIFILRFNPKETDIMNHINFFIENHVKEKNYEGDKDDNKKAFIYSIHMNRIFNSDKDDIKKEKYIERNELGEMISHLSDFYQIFIDDLNGENISLKEIMNCRKEDELFQKCLNLKKEFLKNLYKAFSYFDYEFTMDIPILNQNNYSKYIIKYLKDDEQLVESIIKCILKQKTKERDIFNDILRKNYLKREDVGMISVIQNYLSALFIEHLTQFVFKSEEDQFLSTFVFNKLNQDLHKGDPKDNNKNNFIYKDKEEKLNILENKINDNKENKIIDNKEDKKENQLIKKLIDYYLDTLNTSPAGFNDKIKANKITLLLGLKLPGIKSILNNFRAYAKSQLSERYYNNEKEIRYIGQEENNYMDEVNKYKKRIKNNQKNMETEINKNDLLQKLSELEISDDKKEFFEWLLDDYYLLFLSDTLQEIKNSFEHIEEYRNILRKMISLRFDSEAGGEGDDPVKLLAMKMIWLESNNQYISIILNIYQKISISEKDLFSKIERIIANKEIQYENSSRSPPYTEEINSPFFYILESLLKIITSDFELYERLKNQDFYDFINSLKTIVQNTLIIVNDLIIYSKEVYTIQEFLNIQESLNIVNKSNKESLSNILMILSNQSNLTNIILTDNNQSGPLCENIQKLYDFLIENIGDTNNFPELILNIFVDEMKKIKNQLYRKKLTDIILNNPKLIAKSYPFMKIIITGIIENSPDSILDNLKAIEDNNDLYLDSINKVESDILNEIILSIFDNQFNYYFDLIPRLEENELQTSFEKYYDFYKKSNKKNPTFILMDTSLELFKNCLNYLEEIFNNKQEGKKAEKHNENICKLYCISYIKMYLYKCIHFNHNNNQEFLNFGDIITVIEGGAKNNFRKMIKIYIFKIFFYILNNNYQDFSNYHYPNHGIKFFEDFKDNFNEKKEAMLSYNIYPNLKEYNQYKEIFDKFEEYKSENFKKPLKEFKEYIEKNGIDYFYIISSNVIISNLALRNYVLDSEEYSQYSSFVKGLFDEQLKIPEITKKLFLLFSNDEIFNHIIKPKFISENVKEINQSSFEILLYSLRFCLQSTFHNNKDGFLYSQLLSDKYDEILNKNCIPGNNLCDDIYVNNYYEIEKHLNTKPRDSGAYVCSCGLYYNIEPCGFPTEPKKEPKKLYCSNCKLEIGYAEKKPNVKGEHGMVIREGHYRIFKDEAHKKTEMINDTDENIPNMLLADYKKKVIDPILNKSIHGINQISKVRFAQDDQKVRKLSQVGYRLLNYILYSHLFFANCLGFIPDEKMNSYVCKGMTCIEMLEINWNLLKDALQSKGIQIIQIFINMIFDKIIEKLKNCKELEKNEDREKFESEIEIILENSYNDYEKYSKDYLGFNRNDLQLDKNNMKSIVLELYNVDDYDEKLYPFYKFFLMTTYPTKDNFINKIKNIPEYKRKYPLLNAYLIQENKEKELIKYLPEFNEFVNFMIDNYSYKISREEASKILLKDEEIYKNNQKGFRDLFNKFRDKIWCNLEPYAIKYNKNEEMPPIDLDENKSLDYFLNDDGEMYKGMYIASAYQNFISWQNAFLDQIIDPLRQTGILHHFIKNMGKSIDVQNAKNNEALNFEKADEDLMDIIYNNSKRNIFTMENKINYLNYKQFSYDFDSIESNLGELILPGKVKFNGIDHLRFVTYNFEGFRSNKSSILTDFSKIYKSEPLSLENKQRIYDTIKDKLLNQNNELSKILFSIQLFIYYLTQEQQKENDDINTIIQCLPDYVNLAKECIEFFEKQKLKVNEIIEVYSYIELLCFQSIINILNQKFKKEIEEEKKNVINEAFQDNKFEVIKKLNLSTACRKLISRYLISSRIDNEYNENSNLDLYIFREEMWSKEDWKKKDILEQELKILEKNKITLGHCYELYKLLGGDEEKELEGINIKNEKLKDNNIRIEEERIVKKRRKKLKY